METPSIIALSRAMALRTQLDVIANNVANINTTGFKQQRVQFSEFLDRPAPRERMSMVIDRAVMRDTSQGPLNATGNELDLAIQGDGYFVVDTLQGQRYTRAGRFQLDDAGQLTTLSGLPVLGENGQPIAIPEGTSSVRVDQEGSLYLNGDVQAAGRIDLVSFEREQELLEVGGGLYAADQEPQPAPAETKLQQGVIEGSNVVPVVEMTQMIETLRDYQRVTRFGQNEHQRLQKMIQRLGRPV